MKKMPVKTKRIDFYIQPYTYRDGNGDEEARVCGKPLERFC
jgi:hypothetical protein